MTLQSVSLSSLQPPAANPRKMMDASAIEGLAASIGADGLLQNLVVTKGDGKKYRIVSGERRYRALKLLQKRKEISGSYKVPVEIRDDLSDEDRLRLATIENVQRENLPPLGEAQAFAALLQDGASLDDLAAKTGLSVATIKRRLVLNDLCGEAKEALAEKRISLAMAEALTLGDHDRQRGLVNDLVCHTDQYSPADIRRHLIDDRQAVSMAIFPLEDYTGSITADLFADDETSYFDDSEQFMELQRKAVEKLAATHAEKAAWVEVTESYNLRSWQYEEAEEGEQGGVVINLAPSGRVEVCENLARPRVDQATRTATAGNPLAPKKARPAYSVGLCRSIAWHKSAAVALRLLDNPRKAKEVAIIAALDSLNPHEFGKGLFAEEERASGFAYAGLSGHARTYAEWLGITLDEDRPLFAQLCPCPFDEEALYEKLATLTDGQLDELAIFLTAIGFGQDDCGRLDATDSLFNRIAADLGTDMREHWEPDHSFFSRRSREQLLAIAEECGCANLYGTGMLRSYKKSELVSCLLRHFALARTAEEPTPSQLQARSWLPDAMRFPAIDASAVADDDDGGGDDDDDDHRHDEHDEEEEDAGDDE